MRLPYRGRNDILKALIGEENILLFSLSLLLLLTLFYLWWTGRFYWLYKLIMGDKAKPQITPEARYEQRQARIQAKLRAERLEREAREKQDEQE